jgi:hypothetical protein
MTVEVDGRPLGFHAQSAKSVIEKAAIKKRGQQPLFFGDYLILGSR